MVLIEFSAGNFRSIAELQTISMVASRRGGTAFSTGSSSAPFVHGASCMFGANGAGKSNMIAAMYFAQKLVRRSFGGWNENEEKFDYQPHLLDPELRAQPSRFNFVFLHKGEVFDYSIGVDAERVWFESLFARTVKPRAKERFLFERFYDPVSDKYEWNIGDSVSGPRKTLKKATTSKSLFLSIAAHHKVPELEPAYEWIAYQLRIIFQLPHLTSGITVRHLEDQNERRRVIEFLRSTGIGLVDLDVQQITYDSIEDSLRHFESIGNDQLEPEILPDNSGGFRVHDIDVHFNDRQGNKVSIPLGWESEGTRRLFMLAGPWIETLENGYCLVVDELQNSLHPAALRAIVSTFMRKDLNKKSAQILFTTHDTSILTGGILGRDQIWFCEKDVSGASQYVPFTTFSPRKSEAYQRNYLAGRYGGLPRTHDIPPSFFNKNYQAEFEF